MEKTQVFLIRCCSCKKTLGCWNGNRTKTNERVECKVCDGAVCQPPNENPSDTFCDACLKIAMDNVGQTEITV